MIDHVVVDVEIQKTIEQCTHGWDSTEEMGVAVACLWEYRTQRMRVYGPEDVKELRARLLRADRVSGFNIWNFDYPVIWGISKEVWRSKSRAVIVDGLDGKPMQLKHWMEPRTDDMLRRIWIALGLDPDSFSDKHRGWSLDNVACYTLGTGKIGYGGNAPKWYQTGQVQKVVNYCADDVALERDLTDFVDKYKYVLNLNVRTSPLHIPDWG